MSSWRAMAGRGGDCNGPAMNVASPLPVTLSRADGEGPRRHLVTVQMPEEPSIADVRSLSVLWRIGMTAVPGDHVNGCAN
jgi:hypothetical protein